MVESIVRLGALMLICGTVREQRKIRIGTDDTGYCWMCTQCFWRKSSPHDETDESMRQAMRQFNEHLCIEHPVLSFAQLAV
jgi:hypothetical protein